MAKRKETSQALVHAPDPEKFASDLEDLESMSQKALSSELKVREAHDFIRRYRRWRDGVQKMEQQFWVEAAKLIDPPKPPAPPEAEIDTDIE